MDAKGRQAPSRVLFYPFLLFNSKHYRLKGACTLQGSVNFDNIPVANGVSFDAAFWVGYLLTIPVKVCFYGFEGENQQPIPIISKQ